MARVYRPGAGLPARVRRRRGRLELRIGDSVASCLVPGRAATGSVWDALAAALLALPVRRRRAVLMLGLGGGSAVRIVRALAPGARIVGIEIDPAVLRLAQKRFGLSALGIEVVQADARDYLQSRRERFDLILEDCFIGDEAELQKPQGIPEPAFARAVRLLHPGGVLASNTIDEGQAIAASLHRHFPNLVQISLEGYDNRIFIGGGTALSAGALRRAIADSPVLAPTLPILSLRTLRR